MSSIFREMTIRYGGEDYVLTPSAKMLRRIEDQYNVSIFGTVNKMQGMEAGTDVPIFHVAAIISGFLKEAGASFSEDDVYEDIVTAMNSGEFEKVRTLFDVIVTAISPSDGAVKNADSPAPVKPKRKARTSQ